MIICWNETSDLLKETVNLHPPKGGKLVDCNGVEIIHRFVLCVNLATGECEYFESEDNDPKRLKMDRKTGTFIRRRAKVLNTPLKYILPESDSHAQVPKTIEDGDS